MIHYKCSNCHGALASPDSLVGQKEVCPSCNCLNTVPSESVEPKKESGLATASLVCGICGLAFPTSVLFFASIAGIICGHLAMRRIKKTPDEYGGLKRATAGLWISYIAVAIGLLLGIWLAHMRIEIRELIEALLHAYTNTRTD